MRKLSCCLLLIPFISYGQFTLEATKKKAAVIFETDKSRPQILLLGVFHFAGEKVDANTTKASLKIDILDSKRQQELSTIIDQVAAFKPTIIAIEMPPQYQSRYDSVYKDYCAGKPVTGQSPAAEDEMVQVGFRLGKLFHHEKIYAVNADPFRFGLSSADSVRTFEKYKEMGDSSYAYWEPKYDEEKQLADSLGAFGTLKDYLLYLNDPEKVARANGRWLVTTKRGSLTEPIGADGFITRYWNRNVRIYSNVQKIVKSKEDRILVIYGATHMYLLKTLFSASPEFDLKDIRDYIR